MAGLVPIQYVDVSWKRATFDATSGALSTLSVVLPLRFKRVSVIRQQTLTTLFSVTYESLLLDRSDRCPTFKKKIDKRTEHDEEGHKSCWEMNRLRDGPLCQKVCLTAVDR